MEYKYITEAAPVAGVASSSATVGETKRNSEAQEHFEEDGGRPRGERDGERGLGLSQEDGVRL